MPGSCAVLSMISAARHVVIVIGPIRSSSYAWHRQHMTEEMRMYSNVSFAYSRLKCLCRLVTSFCPYFSHGRHTNIADNCAALMRCEKQAWVLIRRDCPAIYSAYARAMLELDEHSRYCRQAEYLPQNADGSIQQAVLELDAVNIACRASMMSGVQQ